MRRTAFTLIELLVVITVIMVLLGLLLAGLHSAKLAQQRTSTRKQMRDLSQAVSLYLDRSPLLAEDFAARPWYYFTTAQAAAGRDPLFEARLDNLAVASGGSWVQATTQAQAQAIADHIGKVPDGMYQWTIVNDNATYASARYTKSIRMTSTNGTLGDTSDDFWIEWTTSDRAWHTGP